MTNKCVSAVFALLCACLVGQPIVGAEQAKQTWNFDGHKTGEIAKGFKGEVGEWLVTDADQGKVLAQTAKNPNTVFNVTLISATKARDVDISVKMKAVAGELDQGGGIVWRAKDAKNYYLARYNPLEDNYRFYKVIDGKRTQLQNADIVHSDGWHMLRITMAGDHVECYYDGKKYLDHNDSSITSAGMIGLWSKADAQSYFDDLMLAGP
jgi:hypothetical protein